MSRGHNLTISLVWIPTRASDVLALGQHAGAVTRLWVRTRVGSVRASLETQKEGLKPYHGRESVQTSRRCKCIKSGKTRKYKIRLHPWFKEAYLTFSKKKRRVKYNGFHHGVYERLTTINTNQASLWIASCFIP